MMSLARSLIARCYSALRRTLHVAFQLPAAAVKNLCAPAKTNQSRRDLLQGRMGKFIPAARVAPLVMRYPTKYSEPIAFRSPDVKPRSIAGINIDPVPATNLGLRSVARTLPVFRPPGAIDELQFLAGCTRCDDCIAACPYETIRKASDRLGSLAGTPIIEADTAACMMCSDFPCIDACEPGVLSKLFPPIMGTAQVTESLCLAHHQTTCTVCSERCPVDGAIIVADGKPIVNQETCTGCGVCRYVCPAPENAILLMPAFSRPGLPSS